MLGSVYTTTLNGAELPPPGAGFRTVSAPVVGRSISLPRIVTRSCLSLTTTVVRAAPSHRATEEGRKPLPTTMMVVSCSPTIKESGVTTVIVGLGFATTKLAGAEAPPPGAGLKTVIGTVEADRKSTRLN